MTRMTLTVNGESRELAPHTTVADLVQDLGCGTAGVAVAVNAEVIPRSYWDTTELHEHDGVEVLIAMQGG